jgi:hypothetical protein
MDPIKSAIAAINALKPGEEFSYNKIAKRFSVNQSTLCQRHRRLQVPHNTKIINQQKLTQQQEEELITYIEELTTRHIPPTREIIANFASAVAQEPVSKS